MNCLLCKADTLFLLNSFFPKHQTSYKAFQFCNSVWNTHLPKKTNNRSGNICFIFKRYCAICSNEINFCNKGNRKRVSKGVRKVKSCAYLFLVHVVKPFPIPSKLPQINSQQIAQQCLLWTGKISLRWAEKDTRRCKTDQDKQKQSDICLSNHNQSSHPMCMKLVLKWQRQRNAKTASTSCRGFEYTVEKLRNNNSANKRGLLDQSYKRQIIFRK